MLHLAALNRNAEAMRIILSLPAGIDVMTKNKVSSGKVKQYLLTGDIPCYPPRDKRPTLSLT